MGQDVLKRLEISFTGPNGDIQDIFFWWEIEKILHLFYQIKNIECKPL